MRKSRHQGKILWEMSLSQSTVVKACYIILDMQIIYATIYITYIYYIFVTMTEADLASYIQFQVR